MPAKLAGRIVLPFISVELDNPSQMYDKIINHDFDCNLIFGFDALSGLTKEEWDRCRNFIDCLKPESTSSLLENQPEKTTLQGSNEGEKLREFLNCMSTELRDRITLIHMFSQFNYPPKINDVPLHDFDFFNSVRGFYDLFYQTTQDAGGNKSVKISC